MAKEAGHRKRPSSAGISSHAIYVPMYRLSRAEMGKAWGVPALPGERSVANRDEDSLTMAVAAGEQCLLGIDRSLVDAVYFASTTPPYAERQTASLAAAALDLRRDVFSADFTGSVRSATVALRAAYDAVQAGSARSVLVLAADCRPAEPETVWEQTLGDGAAALLVSAQAPAVIRRWCSLSGGLIGPWRRSTDRYVRSFEPKAETEYGYVRTASEAGRAVLEGEGWEARAVSKAVIAAPDPRSQATVARQLGLEMERLQDPLFATVGNTGTALLPMMLSAALEAASPGDRLLVANYGDGADAFLLEVEGEIPLPPGRRPLSYYMEARRALPSYETYVSFRQLVEKDQWAPNSSAVTYWRDAEMEFAFYGARCRRCGTVQYPIPRVCVECGAKDQVEPVRLARKGAIFTFTLDHLIVGKYLNTPVPRVVVDLEGGGRVFLEMTDCDPAEVKVGMPVELTFRLLHSGAEFYNYYWKCRPAVSN